MKRRLPRLPRRRAKRPQATPAPIAEVEAAEAQPAVPAGAEPPDSAAPHPTFRNRARLRRRLRFLRRVRELGFRDLGGLVFDQHRFGRPDEGLVRGKVAALTAVDVELRALERALRDRRDITELREPGLSACPRCGTLHGSDARFCPSCGLALRGSRAIAADVGEGEHAGAPPTEQEPAAAPRAHDEPPSFPTDEPAATHAAEREAAQARDPGTNGARGEREDDQPANEDDQPTAVVRPGAQRAER
jgi:hypothetical protein